MKYIPKPIHNPDSGTAKKVISNKTECGDCMHYRQRIKELEKALNTAIDIGAAFYCQMEYKHKLQEKTAKLMYKKLKALEER